MASEVVSTLRSVCAQCGTVYQRHRSGSKCEDCRPRDDGAKDSNRTERKGTRHQRGYDNTWARLSARARRLQPFCLDCGSPDDLTADHNSRTWERKAAGKVLRLKDIDVVCRTCNGERGAARGNRASDEWRSKK